jgi:hypothetical protein
MMEMGKGMSAGEEHRKPVGTGLLRGSAAESWGQRLQCYSITLEDGIPVCRSPHRINLGRGEKLHRDAAIIPFPQIAIALLISFPIPSNAAQSSLWRRCLAVG